MNTLDGGGLLVRALASGKAALVNVAIDPRVKRKQQRFSWLGRPLGY